MGFGNGYSRRTTRGGKSYNNTQTAHVWNAQSEEAGQSNNGNFYFRERAIYSYGSHYVAGYIMPDGVAFINGRSYSVSTSGHMSDVRNAIADRRRAVIADLTEIAGDWKLLPRLASFLDSVADRGVTLRERADMRDYVRKALVTFAPLLDSPILPAGDWGYGEWTPGYRDESSGEYIGGRYADRDTSGDIAAGAYIAALAGLPAASWDKAKRESDRLLKRAADRDALSQRRVAEGEAIRLADMSDSRFRDWLADMGTSYSDRNMRELGKNLKRARGLMLKAKRGKLASASRLAIVRERIKRVDSAVKTFDVERDRRERAKNLRHSLAIVRQWRDASPEARLNVSWPLMRDVATAAERLRDKGRLAGLKASADRLAILAHIGMDAIASENAKREREEAENRAKALAERIQLWLAGARVGAIRFDAESGGAALRIMGDTLETSHGAEVPLAHAIKAFRFIKLCRERGESFHRNGRTIRVGHFQVDSIEPNGDFVAGCHRFSWQEVERVARIAGVFEQAADDSAVIPSAQAA